MPTQRRDGAVCSRFRRCAHARLQTMTTFTSLDTQVLNVDTMCTALFVMLPQRRDVGFFFFVLFQTLNWFKGEVGDRGLQLSASLQLTLALRSQIRQSLNAGTLTKLAK